MGMYDTVRYDCPQCGDPCEYQSKIGECNLNTYSIANAPLLVLADINDEGRRGRLVCDGCGAHHKIPVRFVAPRVEIVDEGVVHSEWREE